MSITLHKMVSKQYLTVSPQKKNNNNNNNNILLVGGTRAHMYGNVRKMFRL